MVVEEKKFVTIGGGIGSFTWVDALRIYGVPKKDIAIISPLHTPYQQFKKYCDAIGLTSSHRLRSDSGSRPDNYWGFPGYAVSEIWEEILADKPKAVMKTIVQLIIESLYGDFYTPCAGRVYKSIDREAKRIGWSEMLYLGIATSIKKLPNTKIAVSLKTQSGATKIIHTHAVLIALGHTRKESKKGIISAYDNHSYIKEQLKKKGGKVVIIGRGATAAQLVEDYIDLAYEKGGIEVISVFRSKNVTGIDSRKLKQKNILGWRLQQFNFPRASFGGSLIDKTDLLWSKASTIPRNSWIHKIRKAHQDCIYKVVGRIPDADFVIDATGFEMNTYSHPLLQKFAGRNKLVKLGKYFEVEALTSNESAVFLSGINALGNGYGPLDSFLGQQYVTDKTIDFLSQQNWSGIHKSSPKQLFMEWWKWIKNKSI